ncbi:MAG: metal-dependent hydrolase [Halobacteriota archaeon]
MKLLAHSVFAFAFCIVVFELAVPASATNKVFVLLSGTIALTLASVPDLDARTPLRLVPHRSGVSHSIFTVATCACISYVLLSRYPPLDLIIIPAIASAITSHILLDTLTMSGCPLFWPLSRHRFSAHLCKYNNPLANALVVLLSSLAIVVFLLHG